MLISFQRSIFWVIILTYAVILAGSIVRGTDAGLGCPDWPKCFGTWVPPVHVSELPEDYKEKFKIAGKVIADFDAFKTWTEYINRLLGALLGLAILRLFIISFKYKEYEENFPWYCFGILLVVILQGGVGALVVSTHLKTWVISLHMILAMLMLFGLLALHRYVYELNLPGLHFPPDKQNLRMTKILIGIGFIQILLGTQVRENVDHLLRDFAVPRDSLISQLGLIFPIHRSFSILFLVVLGFSLVMLYKGRLVATGFQRGLFIAAITLTSVGTGMGLSYLGFPANLQPFHLFMGMLLMGTLFEQYLHQKGSLLS
jgi:cytochrome c oxidase assembly protein subunit 15